MHWIFPDGATRLVGTVHEVGSAGIEQLTYAGSWLASGFAIGEGLPLTSGPQLPPGGAYTFGVLDDAGPDTPGGGWCSRGADRPQISADPWSASPPWPMNRIKERSSSPRSPRDRTGLLGILRTVLVFLCQAAGVRFRSSRSTSLGVRYPRAE